MFHRIGFIENPMATTHLRGMIATNKTTKCLQCCNRTIHKWGHTNLDNFWTPIHAQSKRWNFGKFCRIKVGAKTAKVEWDHCQGSPPAPVHLESELPHLSSPDGEGDSSGNFAVDVVDDASWWEDWCYLCCWQRQFLVDSDRQILDWKEEESKKQIQNSCLKFFTKVRCIEFTCPYVLND